MTSTISDWDEYFTQSSGIFTCNKKVHVYLVGWVYQYNKAGQTSAKGTIYINGSQICYYDVGSTASGISSKKYMVSKTFNIGETFYFKTPSDNGWPQQKGAMFICSNNNEDLVASLDNMLSNITGGYSIR